ncbi:MAG: glycosyltransferase family 4 protein [Caldilinea sp.]|nr:glycosyltransferase family 4 protein [Caldilinea sp.]MDW8441251.1 glycosyltransferase family 4 protein [Caldilineaceae bacterium]
MRILFLTQVLPYPLDAGPKARAYYVLRYLSQHHEVTLLSFMRKADVAEALDHLRSFCRQVIVEPLTRSPWKDAGYLVKSLSLHRPFLIERDASGAMVRRIEALARTQPGFDAVHADQLWMAPYALHFCKVAAQQGKRPLSVLDQHNAVFMIPRRMADAERNPFKRVLMQLEARKLASFEVETCRRFDRVVWVTCEDYAAVQMEAARRGREVSNDGVLPICGDPESIAPIVRASQVRRVTFLGGLHYPPNAQGVLWFAREIFPLVLRRVPDAILTVIGKQPPSELAALDIPARNLEVAGYVEDPTPYLAETAAFVVPLLAGGGMRVKIIDGWTWGLPIVSTRIGAEGTDAAHGKNILLADEPASFARGVIDLLTNPQLNASIAGGGRRTALERYNWRVVYRGWDRIYVGPHAATTAQEP